MRQKLTFAMWAMLAFVAVALTIRVIAEEPAPAPPTPAQLFIYSGILRAVDLPGRAIVVDGSAVPARFAVPVDADIIVKDKPRGALGDLVVGDGVQVKYIDDAGAHVAKQISLLGLKVP